MEFHPSAPASWRFQQKPTRELPPEILAWELGQEAARNAGEAAHECGCMVGWFELLKRTEECSWVDNFFKKKN